MKLSGIRYIYEARLGARAVLVQEGFAILGIAVGVALLFASQVSSTSLARSVAQLNSQLVGSAQVQLEARGPEGFEEALLGAVREVPGVQVALPIFEQQVNVIGRRGERSVDLIGVDPRSVFASGPLLRRFSAKQLAQVPPSCCRRRWQAKSAPAHWQTIELQVGAAFKEALVGATLTRATTSAGWSTARWRWRRSDTHSAWRAPRATHADLHTLQPGSRERSARRARATRARLRT